MTSEHEKANLSRLLCAFHKTRLTSHFQIGADDMAFLLRMAGAYGPPSVESLKAAPIPDATEHLALVEECKKTTALESEVAKLTRERDDARAGRRLVSEGALDLGALHIETHGENEELRAQVAELTRERDALAARVTELERALAPFARRAGHLRPEDDDDFSAWHPAVGSAVTVGDLRRAALATKNPPSDMTDTC